MIRFPLPLTLRAVLKSGPLFEVLLKQYPNSDLVRKAAKLRSWITGLALVAGLCLAMCRMSDIGDFWFGAGFLLTFISAAICAIVYADSSSAGKRAHLDITFIEEVRQLLQLAGFIGPWRKFGLTLSYDSFVEVIKLRLAALAFKVLQLEKILNSPDSSCEKKAEASGQWRMWKELLLSNLDLCQHFGLVGGLNCQEYFNQARLWLQEEERRAASAGDL